MEPARKEKRPGGRVQLLANVLEQTTRAHFFTALRATRHHAMWRALAAIRIERLSPYRDALYDLFWQACGGKFGFPREAEHFLKLPFMDVPTAFVDDAVRVFHDMPFLGAWVGR